MFHGFVLESPTVPAPCRAIAFVTYKLRTSAEFAKIAMADQSLDHGEVLNVRWATEDPNPKAIEHLKCVKCHIVYTQWL